MLAHQSTVELEVPIKESNLRLRAVVLKWSPNIIETTAPCLNGRRISIPVGTPVDVKETCEDSVLVFHSRLEGIRNGTHLRWFLRMPGFDQIERVQRRKHPRYLIRAWCFWSKDSHLSAPEDEVIQIHDIGSGGALIRADQKLELGEDLQLNLSPVIRLEGIQRIPGFITRARVVRLASQSDHRYGVAFEQLGKKECFVLNKSLMEQTKRADAAEAETDAD